MTDLKEIQDILERNTTDGTLTLPPAALDSAPIAEAFLKYLLDDDLVIRQVSIVPVGGQNITVVGQGGSFPFENSYVTAVFTAPSGVAAMAVEADGFFDQTEVWRFSAAFPVLAPTFYKDLQFTAAKLTVRSSNASVSLPGGLFFSGTQELTGTLAVLSKLLSGATEAKLSGAIDIAGDKEPEKAVPVMTLEDPSPGTVFGMQFFFQLIDTATETKPRDGNPAGKKTVPVPEMQLVSRIIVDTADGRETLDIATHFTPTFGLLTFQADMDQALVVSQAALNALARGANLGSVLPSQLPLVNSFTLGQWSMSVVPQGLEPRITSISMEAGITESWTVIPGLFTLKDLHFAFTITHVNDKYEPTAALTASIDVLDGPAQFTIVVDAQYPSYVITGSLEEGSTIDLIALVRRFLGERIANSLPCKDLRITILTVLIDPRNSTFTLDTVIESNCSFDLGIATFTLTQVDFNFSYVAGQTTGSFRAAFLIVPPQPGIAVVDPFGDDPAGAVAMEVSAAYNGAEDGWSFRGGLATDGKIDLGTIVGLYLPASYQAFIPDVVINQLEAGFETGTSKAYDFTIGAEWNIAILSTKIGALVKVSSKMVDGVRKNDGEVQGFLRFGGDGDTGGLELKVTAKFNDTTQIYIFEFLGWTATMKSSATEKTLTFEAGNRSLGEMIEVLINAIFPGSDTSLAAPWSVLNSIPLGSFKFVVTFSPEDNSAKSASLTYSPNINIGFAQLDDIALEYDVKTGKVMFKITKGRFLTETIGPTNPVEWDVADPDSTPAVPGEGSELFRLKFLGLGQHMAVAKEGVLEPAPASVFGAVTQLNDAFTDKNGRSLVFNEATNWLIAARFVVVQAVDIGVVFYDPELYGLVISVTDSKAAEKLPIFEGLVFEILYKKINDTIGMWQIDLTLPSYIRNLQFGAVSVTLPSMKLQIYTNGNFMVDLGFPANDDFSRSFSVQILPFVGSGGVYFGVLSSETSDKVPKTSKGNFSPVISFGLGLRVGLGKDLDYGVFKAGLSITVQGVLEGVFAWYNKYPAPRALSQAGNQEMVPAGSRQLVGRRSRKLAASASGDDFYYMIQARVALVGKLYGSVDLGIISASLDIEVRVSIRLTLEAYRAIDLFFEVSISVSLKVRINLGLFKITITLSWSMKLSFGLTIGSNKTAPWDQSALLRQATFVRRLDAPIDEQCLIIPQMKWQPILTNAPVRVPLLFVPQFTAATDGPLGTGVPRKPFVVAMTYVSIMPSREAPTAPPPFDNIARGALLWTLNAYLNSDKQNTTLDDLLKLDISIQQLNEIFCYLTQEDILEPFTQDDVLGFLRNFYRFNVTIPPVIPPASAVTPGPDEEVSIFPIMPLLKMKTSTGVEVDFLTKTPSSDAYLKSIKKYFEEMAVRYRTAAERATSQSVQQSSEETEKSLASFLFLDFFALLARATVQDAINLLQTQEASLEADESLEAFVKRRPDLGIDVPSLALANAARALRAGATVRVPGVVYTAKHGDTTESVAAKLKLDTAKLLRANPAANGGPLAPASEIKVPAVTFTTSSTNPESLLDITRKYGVSLAELALANKDVGELFPADQPVLAPHAQQMNVGKLVETLQAKGSFNKLSGLAARVLLQGLRPLLPNESPQGGKTAPLYELTGQQFDGSDLVDTSTITLTVPAGTGEWFQLGNGESLTYTFTTTTADALARLKTATFGPVVTFKDAELLRIEPRRFTLPTSVLWRTPVAIETANSGDEPAPATIEPQLWQFPSELVQIITGKQALQPKVQLFTQRQEGPGQTFPKEPVTNYTWSTVIEITVRQTASGDRVYLPNTYEMTGIDAGGTQLLENLIVWYANRGVPVLDKIRILYPPNPAVPGQDEPPTGLKSDANPTFFLLQNNLSTASQPPQLTGPAASLLGAAAPQQAPLGQTELEFLKLLWESSIVNSGGYVLSYEAQPKQGLPDYLFSQDGIATLTLLITYTIRDNVLQNFLNNVVIHQVIDTANEVLYATPVPQTVTNFQLSPNESLADVAARFRVTVSRLAMENKNAHAKLAPGKHLRIPPVTRRVRAGERLETIAAHAGCTPEEVAALNPGANATNVSAARFLRLPEKVWRAEPVDSLASLAERFNTTVVTLAHANRNVPGLIQGELTFDDRLEEAIATVPPGNVAFDFKRPNVPVSPEVDAKQQLSELYNLLAYRIKEGNGFEGTNSALPVSPETPEGTIDWIYGAVVPVFPFVPPPPATNATVPDPRQDPYNGIGKTVELNFNWQDLFGNWIDSGVRDDSWPNQGFPVGYIDNLIALDQWPSVTSDYVITPGEQSPALSITLRFNADSYLPVDGSDPDADRDMALTDLARFRLIYYQLTQDDVRVTVSSTMQGGNQSAETAPPQDVMVQFVLSIIEFLTLVVAGGAEPPKPVDVAMSQPVADANPANLFALVVRLEITRDLDLVNEEFKDIPAVSLVTSRVPANAATDKVMAGQVEAAPPMSLQEFAFNLETAFPSLKVMVAAPKKSLGQIAEEIWIARFAATPTGIAFQIDGGDPSFFATEPLARNLLSRPDVLVFPYQPGKFIGDETPIKTSQNSVDLDQLGRNFLIAMEQVLGPQFSTATWKLQYDTDTPPPVTDPPNPRRTPYEAIIAAKELLANAISENVTGVFETIKPSGNLADARELLRQQLLVNLTTAFTVDVIVQYPVAITNSEYGDDPLAPRLFGKPVAENPDDPNEVDHKDAFSFSTGRFSLAKRASGTHLTFSFDTNREQQGRAGQQIDDVFTIDLFHQINALEHEIHPVQGIDGYQASSWLTFVLQDNFDTPGERKLLIPLGTQKIPVPLRAYPTPPSLSEQTFIPHVKQFVGGGDLLSTDGRDELLKARLWDYRCQYEYVGAAHDKILASIKLNVPPDKKLLAKFNDIDNPDLFAAMVQFTAAYPGIAKDLDQFLATGTDSQIAFNAIASFAWLAQRAANAWLTWQNANELYTAAPPESPEYHFVIAQGPAVIGDVTALVVSVTADTSSLRLPQLPLVEIAGYTTAVVSQTPDSVSYKFVSNQDEKLLTYAIGRNLSSRQLVFRDFDILTIENSWAGAAVKRNENLLPPEVTNPAFILQSPVVRFVNVLTPLLDPDVEINIADFTTQKPSPLPAFLSNFLIAFFETALTIDNEFRTIRLAAAYGYGLHDAGGFEASAGMPDLDITIPILLTTPTQISILKERLSPESPFISSVSDTIIAWFCNNKPIGLEENAKLWFDLSVYSSLSESQLPVLRMRRLFLSTSLLLLRPCPE